VYRVTLMRIIKTFHIVIHTLVLRNFLSFFDSLNARGSHITDTDDDEPRINDFFFPSWKAFDIFFFFVFK
jgi:hypothetical protein